MHGRAACLRAGPAGCLCGRRGARLGSRRRALGRAGFGRGRCALRGRRLQLRGQLRVLAAQALGIRRLPPAGLSLLLLPAARPSGRCRVRSGLTECGLSECGPERPLRPAGRRQCAAPPLPRPRALSTRGALPTQDSTPKRHVAACMQPARSLRMTLRQAHHAVAQRRPAARAHRRHCSCCASARARARSSRAASAASWAAAAARSAAARRCASADASAAASCAVPRRLAT